MNDPVVKDLERVFRGELLYNEPLSRHTSLKVGGPADLFAVPADKSDLQELLKVLERFTVPWFIIGGGYNVLVNDSGFRGAAISLKKLNKIEISGQTIYAEAGATNQALACFARDNELRGLEFLIGIPGSVGGALCMNAGAHGGEILDHLDTIELLQNGKLAKHTKNLLNYSYRRLQVSSNELILAAEFTLSKGGRESIAARMDECLQSRRKTQNVGLPNAGSFFRNPPGLSAWRLIEDTGLRGLRQGSAQVSEVHANFLVNLGNATAEDFMGLAEIIKERVSEKSGIRLEEEVKII